MKNLFVAFLWLLGATVLGADAPDDGIYAPAGLDTPARWSVKTQDGRLFSLGAKQDLKIEESSIHSVSNSNDWFNLTLTIPYVEDLCADPSRTSYILVVSGTAYAMSGSSSSRRKKSHPGFHISGDHNAIQVSDYFKIPVCYRKRPEYDLRLSFSPTKEDFRDGEEVSVKFKIANVGTNGVSFLKHSNFSGEIRDRLFSISARCYDGRPVIDIALQYSGGHNVGHPVVKPGDSVQDEINLRKWLQFDRAGLYKIHGSYRLEFCIPGGRPSYTIWEDKISADFMVRIKD